MQKLRRTTKTNAVFEKNKFFETKIDSKTQSFYTLLAFLLITIILLIAVSIYCYLIKYWAKQKHLLPCHQANNVLKQVLNWQYKLKMSNKIKDINIKKPHVLRYWWYYKFEIFWFK